MLKSEFPRWTRYFTRLGVALLSLWVLCLSAFAEAPAEFNAANNLYDKADFKGARAAYESLVKSGNWSAHLFYNLGNAAYRDGDKSAAFLAYERALALEPELPEAKANLQFLRGETSAKLSAVPWYGHALSWPSSHEATWLALAAFWGLLFSVAPRLWKKPAASIPALFCALLLIWSGAIVTWQNGQGELWIVVTDATKPHSMPTDSSAASASLPMGSQVRLVMERGAWVYVRLPDGTKGWMTRDAVQPVRLSKIS